MCVCECVCVCLCALRVVCVVHIVCRRMYILCVCVRGGESSILSVCCCDRGMCRERIVVSLTLYTCQQPFIGSVQQDVNKQSTLRNTHTHTHTTDTSWQFLERYFEHTLNLSLGKSKMLNLQKVPSIMLPFVLTNILL